MATTGLTHTQYGPAQLSFIRKTRKAVDADSKSFFAANNWRNIAPSGGRCDSGILDASSRRTCQASSFYIKGIACWIPHKLIPNHTPKCPQCKKNQHVDVTKVRWVNSPKILYGVERHRYLDTVLYPCRNCAKRFTGYNKKSMQLDASVYYAFFNFYLGDRYAVDDELYRKIVLESSTESTSSIQKRLTHLAYDAYLYDHQLFLCALSQNKIKRQKTSILKHFTPSHNDPHLLKLQRKKTDAMSKFSHARLSLRSGQVKAEADIDLKSLLRRKENHNLVGDHNIIRGLGPSKISALIRNRIYTTKELLHARDEQYPGICHLLPIWKQKVQEYYDRLKLPLQLLEVAIRDAQEDLENAEMEYANYALLEADCGEGEINAAVPVSPAVVWPPTFSKFDDKQGYNGRVISKFAVDSIATTVFNQRKAFMEAKMKGVCASILKIDFNYKLASKIRVWTKQGQSFCPFKCIVTIQNEDGLTVFWKALKHSESFTEIKDDLIRLRRRLNRNAKSQHEQREKEKQKNDEEYVREIPLGHNYQAVKVVYVDNCCQVKNIVGRCFPNAIIKLDVFHWLKRWNKILVEPSSAQGGVFRGLMCRALFNIEPTEYAAAKERVIERLAKRKINREPYAREITKEARTTIPDGNLLRRNVQAVFTYLRAKDTEIEAVLAMRTNDDTSPEPKKFFRTNIASVVREQLKHVDCNCLSDPPSTLVNIWRKNPVTGAVYVARGTNTNERDNLDLAYKILIATHIGMLKVNLLHSYGCSSPVSLADLVNFLLL
jgi:hypothetical protein